MGLETTTNSNKYLYIIHGKIAEKSAEGEPGAVRRVNKNEKVVWEKLYNAVSGYITGCKVERSDYGDQLSIYIEDDNRYCLNVSVESAFFRSFVSKLGNIDLTKPVRLSPYSFKDGEKTKQGFAIYQDEQKVGYFIGKDNLPEGYPAYPDKASEEEFKIYLIQKTKWEKEYINKFQFPKVEKTESNKDKAEKMLGELRDKIKSTPSEDVPF